MLVNLVLIKTAFRAVPLAFVNESFKYTNISLMPVKHCSSVQFSVSSETTNSYGNTDKKHKTALFQAVLGLNKGSDRLITF